jgi:hypothetical protein
MKSLHYKLAIFAIAIALMVDYMSFGLTAYPIGKTHAFCNISAQDYRIKMTGGPIDSTIREYKRLLGERYNISVDHPAFCIYQPWEFKYAETYNSISKPAIIKKFGRDAFKECYKDAWRNMLAKNPPADDEERKFQEEILKTLEKE